MSASSKGGGGSFRDIRERHLPLFEHGPRRADVDAIPPPPPEREEPRRSWKRSGIFHFADAEDEN